MFLLYKAKISRFFHQAQASASNWLIALTNNAKAPSIHKNQFIQAFKQLIVAVLRKRRMRASLIGRNVIFPLTQHRRQGLVRYLTAAILAGTTVLICVEGAFSQSPASPSHYAALYTFYSPSRGDHFTTTDPAWAGTIGTRRSPDYRLIRIDGSVLSADFPQPPDTVPLYSFWNSERNDNFLTSNPAWTSRTSGDGYTRFRLEGYLYAEPKAGTRPLVNLWSATRRDNFATTDPRLALPLNQAVGNRTDTIANGDYRTYRIEGFMLPPAADDIHQLSHAANLQQIAFGNWRPLMPSERGTRPAGALQRANARFTSNLVIVPLDFADVHFGRGDFARYTRFATSTDPLSLEAGVRSLSRGRFTWKTTLTPVVRDPLPFDRSQKLDDAWRAFHRQSQRLDSGTTIRWSPELFQRRHGFSLDVYDLDGDGVKDDEINIRSRVLKLASRFIRFDQFDANGDGRVDSSELVVLRFGADPGIGGQMGGSGDVTARGKRIATSVGLVAKDTTRAGLIHELLHVWGGTDIYGPGFQLNSRNSIMAAMAGEDSFWDLDPWHLAKFGWVRPRFVAIGPTGSQGGGIELMQAAGHDDTGVESARPIVFFDPSRGLNEYFMAQYRTQFPKCSGSGFLRDLCPNYRDNGVADTGIAVWHVMTNADGSLRDIRKIDDRSDRIAWPAGTADDGHMFRLGVVDPVDGKLGGSRYLKEEGHLSLRWWDGTDSGLRIRAGLLSPTSQVAVMEWRDVSRAFTPRLDTLRVTGFPSEEYPTVNAGQRVAFDGLFGINANAVSARLVSESGGEYSMQTVSWSPTRMIADVPSNAPSGRYRLVVAPPAAATNSAWRSNGLRLQIPVRTLSIPSLPRDFDQRFRVPALRDFTQDFDRLDLQSRPLPVVSPLPGPTLNPHGYGGELLAP